MNNYEEYLAKRRQDPEYREVEKRLKPILDLADNVLRLRMERGWTQAELAKRVRTRQSNISRLENGLANPTFKFLEKLSEVFGVELVVCLGPLQPTEVLVQPPAILFTDGVKRWDTELHTPSYPGSMEVGRLWFQEDDWAQIQKGLVTKADSSPVVEWDKNPPTQYPCVA